MNTVVIPYSSIRQISEKGISYDNGTICFSECVKAFNARHNTNSPKCIGERNILEEPPYFELYGNDCQYKIIFDSTGLFANKKNSRQFHELQNIIQNVSYGTRDMT